LCYSRDGLQPLDLEVGQWLRKHASSIRTIVAMNKSESLDEHGLLAVAAGEAYKLGFGDPVAISAETGLGMAELYEILRPFMEDYMLQIQTGTILDFLYCSAILQSSFWAL
jgi:predicted GTPase